MKYVLVLLTVIVAAPVAAKTTTSITLGSITSAYLKCASVVKLDQRAQPLVKVLGPIYVALLKVSVNKSCKTAMKMAALYDRQSGSKHDRAWHNAQKQFPGGSKLSRTDYVLFGCLTRALLTVSPNGTVAARLQKILRKLRFPVWI